MDSRLAHAEHRSQELGHRLEWNTVGDHLAHGECTICGATINVVYGEHFGTAGGDAMAVECPAVPRDADATKRTAPI